MTIYVNNVTGTSIASETLRASITEVPGEGPIRGVWAYDDTLYVWRDNVGATLCDCYEATSGGWSKVAALSGLGAGGRYDFVNANFTAAANGEKMYFVNGVDLFVYEWDGTTLTSISGGAPGFTIAPRRVDYHENYLWVALEGSVAHSDQDDPTTWTGLGGAAEWGIGDYVTGVLPVRGNVIAIFSKNRINIITGASAASFARTTHSLTVGASEWTQQVVNDAFFMDTVGLTTLAAVQSFGDFSDSEVSDKIRPLATSFHGNENGSLVNKTKSLYRVFANGSDTTGTDFITMGIANGQIRGFTRGHFDFNLTCCETVEISGEERYFCGANDGFVYELEKGPSFDGGSVAAVLRLPFNHVGSPTMIKQFRNIWMDITAARSMTITFGIETNYGSSEKPPLAYIEDVLGLGGYWGQAVWGEFIWSGQPTFPVRGSINANGENIAVIVSTDTIHEPAYSVKNMMFHYQDRRPLR